MPFQILSPHRTCRALLVLAGLSTLTAHADTPMPVRDSRQIERVLVLDAAGTPSLSVDNVFGPITVRPGKPGEIVLHAEEAFRARNQEALERARREVRLDIHQDGNDLQIVVEGPFRCEDDRHCIRWRDPGYRPHYAFELRVPPRIDLALRTVTDGDIDVAEVAGTFAVENVNGDVDLEDVGGHGEASTVNGAVTLRLRQVPTGDWSLETVNGDVDTYAPHNLAADLHLGTTYGDVFTDFDVTAEPPPRNPPERRDGLFVLHRAGGFFGRIGAGGTLLRCKTLNGDIALRRTGLH